MGRRNEGWSWHGGGAKVHGHACLRTQGILAPSNFIRCIARPPVPGGAVPGSSADTALQICTPRSFCYLMATTDHLRHARGRSTTGDHLMAGRYSTLGSGSSGVLGRGAYGRVFPCWDTVCQRLVAVKEQRADSKHAVQEMRYLQVLAMQKAPNIIELLDTHVQHNNLYLPAINVHYMSCPRSIRSVEVVRTGWVWGWGGGEGVTYIPQQL